MESLPSFEIELSVNYYLLIIITIIDFGTYYLTLDARDNAYV